MGRKSNTLYQIHFFLLIVKGHNVKRAIASTILNNKTKDEYIMRLILILLCRRVLQEADAECIKLFSSFATLKITFSTLTESFNINQLLINT